MPEVVQSIASARVLPPAHIVGQEMATHLLMAALQKGRVTSAYCFFGPQGVGRSLLARWFAQALLCESSSGIPCGQCSSCHWLLADNHPDLHWVSPSYLHQGRLVAANSEEAQNLQWRSPPQIRLEQVQAVARFCARRPIRAQRSVVVMEGCETLAESAANALLKTLEEPGLAHIILIAPQAASLLPTVLSRCQRVPFRRLSPEEIGQVLSGLGYEELAGIPRSDLIALAQGSPGLALVAHEQLQGIPLELLQELKRWPHSLPQALELGRAVATHLDVPAQLWLIDYLQQHFWAQGSRQPIQQLEHIRRQLLQFVQPRLSWEVNLAGSDARLSFCT
ncbi:DNA polymerase III subunit delta' [Synechococcus sp. Nb3U1]|uniref:DNA polymerase III subunit delta' n=1 Tax=Synechococcus sp. Nb3U1 TaxID=1914529 RepID=UPI001F2DAE98|nr:DNA polymerase III subunit delta' [Synechococcus sp. Nb3U1]MCF2970064.1 DNA polymerase III subunit delta' [Synechococcus sp. Nb3U1]